MRQLPTFNTTLYDNQSAIAVDGSDNVYVSYQTDGTTSSGTNSGLVDIVVFKLDTNGNEQWILQLPIFNTISYDGIPSIAVDGTSNIYISYFTNGTVSGGTNAGSYDIAVFKLA